MANNLFIAYDLMSPGQNYEAVRDRIKSLGMTWQFQFSLFYLSTDLTAAQAAQAVLQVMDRNDRLAVICADRYVGAFVTNWDHPPIDAINAIWSKP